MDMDSLRPETDDAGLERAGAGRVKNPTMPRPADRGPSPPQTEVLCIKTVGCSKCRYAPRGCRACTSWHPRWAIRDALREVGELAAATRVLADTHDAEDYAYAVELKDQLTYEVDQLSRQLVHARRAAAEQTARADDLGARLASVNRLLTNLAAVPPPAPAPQQPPRVRQNRRHDSQCSGRASSSRGE